MDCRRYLSCLFLRMNWGGCGSAPLRGLTAGAHRQEQRLPECNGADRGDPGAADLCRRPHPAYDTAEPARMERSCFVRSVDHRC